MDKALKVALNTAYRAAWGQQLDREIPALQDALERALNLLGVSAEAEKLREYVDEEVGF